MTKRSGIPTGDIVLIVFIAIMTGIFVTKIALDLYFRQ